MTGDRKCPQGKLAPGWGSAHQLVAKELEIKLVRDAMSAQELARARRLEGERWAGY